MNGRELLRPSNFILHMLLRSTIRQRHNPVGYFCQKPFKQADDCTRNRSVVAIKNMPVRRMDHDWYPGQPSSKATHDTRLRGMRVHEPRPLAPQQAPERQHRPCIQDWSDLTHQRRYFKYPHACLGEQLQINLHPRSFLSRQRHRPSTHQAYTKPFPIVPECSEERVVSRPSAIHACNDVDDADAAVQMGEVNHQELRLEGLLMTSESTVSSCSQCRAHV